MKTWYNMTMLKAPRSRKEPVVYEYEFDFKQFYEQHGINLKEASHRILYYLDTHWDATTVDIVKSCKYRALFKCVRIRRYWE